MIERMAIVPMTMMMMIIAPEYLMPEMRVMPRSFLRSFVRVGSSSFVSQVNSVFYRRRMRGRIIGRMMTTTTTIDFLTAPEIQNDLPVNAFSLHASYPYSVFSLLSIAPLFIWRSVLSRLSLLFPSSLTAFSSTAGFSCIVTTSLSLSLSLSLAYA